MVATTIPTQMGLPTTTAARATRSIPPLVASLTSPPTGRSKKNEFIR